MAQLWAKATLQPSQGCGMQKAGAGAIHHQAHPDWGVPARPFRGAGMESVHLVGSRGSAEWGGSTGELRLRLPFLCRGFWRSWTTWLQGPAGPGSSPRPPPTQVSGRLVLYRQRHRGIFFNQCKIGPDGAGRAMGGACSGQGRAALCVGAGRAPGPALPAIEVTDEWDVPDAPHSSGRAATGPVGSCMNSSNVSAGRKTLRRLWGRGEGPGPSQNSPFQQGSHSRVRG